MKRLSSNTTITLLYPVAIRSHIAIVVGFICYVGLVTIVTSIGWPPLSRWFALWNPVVDAISQYVPAFDNVKRILLEKGFGHRVAVFQHLMMAGWLFLSLALPTAVIVIFTNPPAHWKTGRSAYSPERLGLLGVASIAALAFGAEWAIFSFGSSIGETARFAPQKYNLTLFMDIVSTFLVTYGGACAFMIVIGAFLTGRPKSRREWDDSAQGG